MTLTQLQDQLGYQFGDRRALIQALTHRSYGHEKLQSLPLALRDNERLEFLGDAILDVVISDILIESFPECNEGQLTKMRAAIVNEGTLAQVASALHLSDCMRLGRGEEQTGGQTKPSILCSALEALIAAIYLDGGFHAVYPVVRHLFAVFFRQEGPAISFYDHKTQLQELVQARFKITPTYHLVTTRGPDHAKEFEIEVRMKGEALGRAAGPSKKQAEQNAAQRAIELMSR